MSQAPTPVYIFRGHTSQVNTVCWLDNNKYLCSGDLEGNMILWEVETRRPKMQWKGHKESVLSIQATDATTIVSQGRDNHIHTWKIENAATSSSPTLHSSLLYNSVTFCKIALCIHDNETLTAVPSHTDPGLIDIYDLFRQWRQVADIGQEEIVTDSRDTVMSMVLFVRDHHVHLLAGYESGRTILRIISGDKTDTIWAAQHHTVPVLSLIVRSDLGLVFSACSDGQIVRSDLQDPLQSNKSIRTKSGLEQLCIRDDAKVIATAGWDNRIRVFSAKTLKPLAVLSFHRESVYSVAFCSLPAEKHYLVGASKDQRISLWTLY